MTDPTQLTPDQAMAAMEDMLVKRMLGILEVLLKQNAVVMSVHESTVTSCLIATVAHELVPLAAQVMMGEAEEPSLILPGGG